MSWAFREVLTRQPNQSYKSLLVNIRALLATKYEQKPVLSSSHPIDTRLQYIMWIGKVYLSFNCTVSPSLLIFVLQSLKLNWESPMLSPFKSSFDNLFRVVCYDVVILSNLKPLSRGSMLWSFMAQFPRHRLGSCDARYWVRAKGWNACWITFPSRSLRS
jgi:hypothetical protein